MKAWHAQAGVSSCACAWVLHGSGPATTGCEARAKLASNPAAERWRCVRHCLARRSARRSPFSARARVRISSCTAGRVCFPSARPSCAEQAVLQASSDTRREARARRPLCEAPAALWRAARGVQLVTRAVALKLAVWQPRSRGWCEAVPGWRGTVGGWFLKRVGPLQGRAGPAASCSRCDRASAGKAASAGARIAL